MALYGTVDDLRFSFIKPRTPAISHPIDPAPLPRPDLEAEAISSTHRQMGRVLEAQRMAGEMKELAEGFLANFEGHR